MTPATLAAMAFIRSFSFRARARSAIELLRVHAVYTPRHGPRKDFSSCVAGMGMTDVVSFPGIQIGAGPFWRWPPSRTLERVYNAWTRAKRVAIRPRSDCTRQQQVRSRA